MEGKIQIHCYVMRHGQPEKSTQQLGQRLDTLTPHGCLQATTTGARHLKGIKLDAVYYSGMKRALETIQLALNGMGHHSLRIQKEEGFGFTWLLSDPNMPQFDFFAVERMFAEKNGDNPQNTKVAEWFEPGIYPPMWAMRGRMTGALLDVSRRVAQVTLPKPEYNILIGSHGPTGAAAVLDPANTPCLGFADMIRYTVEARDSDPNPDLERYQGDRIYQIVASEHIPAPPCE